MQYWDELKLPPFDVAKTRAQPNPYDETDVFDGPFMTELRADPSSVPTNFSCTVLCSDQQQTSNVAKFFRKAAKNDAMLFYKDLPTEFGIEKHLVRLTGGIPQPNIDRTGRNDMIYYSFIVYVQEVVKPESIKNNPELYLRFSSSSLQIDRAVNLWLPESD